MLKWKSSKLSFEVEQFRLKKISISFGKWFNKNAPKTYKHEEDYKAENCNI